MFVNSKNLYKPKRPGLYTTNYDYDEHDFMFSFMHLADKGSCIALRVSFYQLVHFEPITSPLFNEATYLACVAIIWVKK